MDYREKIRSWDYLQQYIFKGSIIFDYQRLLMDVYELPYHLASRISWSKQYREFIRHCLCYVNNWGEEPNMVELLPIISNILINDITEENLHKVSWWDVCELSEISLWELINKSSIKQILLSKSSLQSVWEFIETNNLFIESNSHELNEIIDKVLLDNNDTIQSIKSGNYKAINKIIGLVKKQTGNKYNITNIKELITSKI